jgi:hypothetical protein
MNGKQREDHEQKRHEKVAAGGGGILRDHRGRHFGLRLLLGLGRSDGQGKGQRGTRYET